MTKEQQLEEIRIFQDYLKIPTVHPDVDYSTCVHFLREQANSLQLPISTYYPDLPTQPIVVITWQGIDNDLPSIVLNSHMDVVPVFESYWTHPPFGAEIDAEGRIFARGAQDMKCVGMQYLAAIRALKRDGFKPKRTIHITFVPDEERGGYLGMAKFIETDAFQNLNIGFALDEGIASPTETYSMFYAERTVWVINIKCNGVSGHSSFLHKNTAVEKAQFLINKFMDYRNNEANKLEQNKTLRIGDVTTINLTKINGGVQNNVVPPEISMIFDIRIALDVDLDEFESKIRNWCEEAGNDIDLKFISKEPYVEPTKLDSSNPFWIAFQSVLVQELNLKIDPLVFPGGTDSRYLRKRNIPVIGFSPINLTPVLLHEHDEYLHTTTYLKGIHIYKKLLSKIANI